MRREHPHDPHATLTRHCPKVVEPLGSGTAVATPPRGFAIRPRNRRVRAMRGATLVEMMIGLSLAAGLLTASAVALDASLHSYEINQSQSSLTQRARLAMHRVLSAVRAGEDHFPYSSSQYADFRGGWVVDDTGITMRTSDGQTVVYRYDSTNKRVLADVNGSTHTMLENVEQFTVKLEPMKSAAHVKAGRDYDLLRRATILLTINSSDATPLPGETKEGHKLTISSSAMPRRNAW